ncbi:MAG: DUF4148 domain-containing protein [Rubrivivax sp.]
MKTFQLIALATLTLAGAAARADDPTVVVDHFQPGLTRAEVKSGVVEAHRSGVLDFAPEIGSRVVVSPDAPQSTLTRAEVRQQAIEAQRGLPILYPLA